jgi:fructose-1,6-bisphosphatase
MGSMTRDVHRTLRNGGIVIHPTTIKHSIVNENVNCNNVSRCLSRGMNTQ